MDSTAPKFLLCFALLVAGLVGGVYFIPQLLYAWRNGAPQILFEENYDETAYAVWTAQAAGERLGWPDPYQLKPNATPPVSFSTIQPLPPRALAALARLLSLRVTTVFWLGSFFFPALAALLFFWIAWLCGLREWTWLALIVCFSLLAFPPVLWLMQWKYVTGVLSGQFPGFRLILPHSRRFQPQFTAMIHYAVVALSLFLLKARRPSAGWALGLLTGIGFGASFYCYYFSWSLLLGWFVLGGLIVWRWQSARLRYWCLAMVTGLFIALPYFLSLAKHFSEVSTSAASAHTRRVPYDPALVVILLICLGLVIALRWSGVRRELIWTPLVLNLAALGGAVQNVLTGIYVQPYHYLHYFARPTANFGLIILCYASLKRFSAQTGQSLLVRTVVIIASSLTVLTGAATQVARYQESSPAARQVMTAVPAMQFLQQHAAAGELVYCPEPAVREALPLYTKTAPFFSIYLLLHETPSTRTLLQERVAAQEVLRGRSESEFATWLQTRPSEAYLQLQQRVLAPSYESEVNETTAQLLSKFKAILQTERPLIFSSLRYALLPTTVELSTTRLTQYFTCQPVWSDTSYKLFALTAK